MKKNSKAIWKYILTFVFIELLLFAVLGTVYVIAQYSLRNNVNDPLVRFTEDAAETLKLGNGMPTVSGVSLDISKSLSTFYVLYNKEKQIVSSNGLLDGVAPSVPNGVLDYAKEHGEDRVTWEPKAGVRIATIARYYKDKEEGYIVAGRSLKEIEIRATMLMKLSILSFTVSTVVTGLFLFVLKKFDYES